MLQSIKYNEIPVLDTYIKRVRNMFRCDGTVTPDEERLISFFEEVRTKIDSQLSISDNEKEFVAWCKTDEIRAIKRVVREWITMSKSNPQPEELVDCYGQIHFLLERSVHFYSED